MITTNIKIKNEPGFHPNTSFEFTDTGMNISVSLNIEPELRKYLNPICIFKGKEFYVYRLETHMMSGAIKKGRVQSMQNMLLKNCMIAIREAKKKLLDNQIKEIKKRKPVQLEIFN